MDIAKIAKEHIEKVVTENNYKIDEVIYEKEDNINFLRVVIDKDGIIDVEDCVTVSGLINPLLDDLDFIDDSYVLDVCSKERGNE